MLLEPIRARGTRLYELSCEHDRRHCGQVHTERSLSRRRLSCGNDSVSRDPIDVSKSGSLVLMWDNGR